jgi:hypothetical protein
MAFLAKSGRVPAWAAALSLWALPAAAQVAPVSPGAPAAPAAPQAASNGAEAARARLQAAAPSARFTRGLATGLKLTLAGETPTARAQAFVAQFGEVFALPAGSVLVARDAKGRSVRFEQQHDGLAVRNAGVTFAFDAEGRLSGYTDEAKRFVSVLPATLDEGAALRVARTTLGLPESGPVPAVRRTLMAQGEVAAVVFEIDLLVAPPMDVRRVLVDAAAGRVIGQEAMVRK